MKEKSAAAATARSSGDILHAERKNALSSIRALKFENGRLLQLKKFSDPVFIDCNGQTYTGLPPRTVIKLLLTPAKGSNIHVEIWLPAKKKWNGRFLGLGNGGAAGNINPLIFIQPVIDGYAAASTDMGTSPNADSGIGNREVWKDFGYRATHLMTVEAKRIIQAYYGRAPEFSYFSGKSTGGQQAMQESQRYPEDYDGILAQVPAHCRTPLHAYFLWNYQILQQCPFSKEQEAGVIAAANEYMACRETPQTAGRIISDPRCTREDIEAVIAAALKKNPTLTDRHAEALRKLFTGPIHSVTGERIFNGLPFGAAFDGAYGNLYLFDWVFGKNRDLATINFSTDIDTYTAELGPYLNAENPDLRRFEERGGKLIIVSGTADSCVPYHATLDYYERVINVFGSQKKTRSFCCFYMIPGMSHGPVGPGVNNLPDLLNLLMQWREKGVRPGTLTGKRYEENNLIFEVPIYPYPGKAVFDKKDGKMKKKRGVRGGVSRIAKRFRPELKESMKSPGEEREH